MSHATIPNEDLTSMRRRIVSIFGSSIGNLIEWYDFYVYNFFALYFARSFFPNSTPTAQGSLPLYKPPGAAASPGIDRLTRAHPPEPQARLAPPG